MVEQPDSRVADLLYDGTSKGPVISDEYLDV
jgi:hypothetical protein